jgi:DNA helicase IV
LADQQNTTATRETVEQQATTGAAMSAEMAAEQAHIDRAYARLAVTKHEAAGLAETLSPGERGGAHQERLLRAAAIEAGRRRLEMLLTGGSALCFGRIDTPEDTFHIGRTGVADAGGDQLIVDWRAPVAEPFYRATGVDPMGLRRRRHIRTRDGRVVALDDEWLDRESLPDAERLSVVGEAALLAAVTRARTGRMGDIVSTIQVEQDRAIRSPISGVLVIDGGPGTGKTAVALHRAAYLLYTHRRRLERVGVLIVGPNPVFLRYIEHVLPSLDEQAVVMATPAQLYERVRTTVPEAAAVRALKGDARMVAVIERAVTIRQRPLRQPATVPYGRHVLTIGRRQSAAIVAAAQEPGGTHNEGHERARRLLLSHLFASYQRSFARATPAGGEPSPLVPFADFAATVADERAFKVALARIWPALTPERLLQDLYAHPALLAKAAEGSLADDEWAQLARDGSDPAGPPRWTSADIPLLDEAAWRLGPVRRRKRAVEPGPQEDAEWMADRVLADLEGIAVGVDAEMVAAARRLVEENVRGPAEEEARAWPREFAHVVVDEAQELTAMQWRMLTRRCPSGSFTVAGDLSQASGIVRAAEWHDALAAVPGGGRASVVRLTVNYRTPSEVMTLAAAVLEAAHPGVAAPTSLRSSGVEPTVTAVDAGNLVGAGIARARSERTALEEGTVAVIAPATLVGDARAAAEADAVTAQGGAELLDGPVSVLTLPEAKGLEFDSVILLEPAGIVDEATDGLAALYVALTRTTSRLAIVHARPLPPSLAAACPPQRIG